MGAHARGDLNRVYKTPASCIHAPRRPYTLAAAMDETRPYSGPLVLWQQHKPDCRGDFRRLYVRKQEPQARPLERGKVRWAPVGWHCESCRVVILEDEAPDAARRR